MNKFFTCKYAVPFSVVAQKIFVCSALLGAGVSFASQEQSHSFITTLLDNQTPSDDITTLRKQLFEKTRELQDYKANLFRASHPQDQATIGKLSQQIAEHERTKQELIEKIQGYETELTNAKKQITNLEVSADALTAFIQNQRAVVEAKKQELAAKIRAYEEDPQLENERELNKKLSAELESLKSTLLSYEQQIKDLESHYEKELHDALQDAAMLKFELADARLTAERKEHEIMVSTLHDLTIALDHAKSLKAHHATHQQKLNESEQSISTLQAALEQEKYDKEHLASQYAVEKHVLESTISEHSETISHALIAHQMAIKDYVADLLSQSEEKANELEQAIHSLTRIAEHQDHALAEANSAFSMAQEYNQYLEMENTALKNRLHQLEIAERTISRSHFPDAAEKKETPQISPALLLLLKPQEK